MFNSMLPWVFDPATCNFYLTQQSVLWTKNSFVEKVSQKRKNYKTN